MNSTKKKTSTYPLAKAWVLWMCVGISISYAQSPGAPAVAQPNAVQRAAEKSGITNCAGRMGQVSNFIGFGPQAGALLMLAPKQPDQNLAPLLMEVPTEGGAAYVSASFAPNQANACVATYDAVMFWHQPCDTVVVKQFSQLKKVGVLKKDITVLDGGAALKVFLMTAGQGCVSIKKENIF